MARSEIQSIEVSFLIHATEEEARVDGAVRALFDIRVAPAVETLEGHFGNRIVRIRYHITGEEASHLLARIASILRREDLRSLLDEFGKSVDEHGALYLRANKQEVLAGRLVLSESDSVQIKVKPRALLVKEGPLKFFARILGASA